MLKFSVLTLLAAALTACGSIDASVTSGSDPLSCEDISISAAQPGPVSIAQACSGGNGGFVIGVMTGDPAITNNGTANAAIDPQTALEATYQATAYEVGGQSEVPFVITIIN
nr:hypothetical protein BdHM001_36390 [Bdellovibrio sp. HM001]